MARVALDLENSEDLAVLGTTGWRIAPGLVPGEPNQGLVAELRGSPGSCPITTILSEIKTRTFRSAVQWVSLSPGTGYR